MEKLEKFERYLFGDLTKEQKNTLKLEIESDSETAQDLERFNVATDVIKTYNTRKLITGINQDYQKANPFTGFSKGGMFRPVRLLAAVLLLFLTLSVYKISVLNSDNYLSEEVIPYSPVTYRAEAAESSEFEKLKIKFRNKNFTDVNETLSKQTGLSTDLLFLRALSRFNLKNYADAKTDFLSLKKENSSSAAPKYVYEIDYYYAMSLLGNEEFDEAYTEMYKLKNNRDNPYSKSIDNLDLFKLKIIKIKNF